MNRSPVLRTIGALSLSTAVSLAGLGACGGDANVGDAPGTGGNGGGGGGGADGTARGDPTGEGGGGSDVRGGDGSTGGKDAIGDRSAAQPDGTSTVDGNIPDVRFSYDAPVRDVALTTDSACASTGGTASLQPVDMFVMLDRSGSMSTDCNVGGTAGSKWCNAINSLSAYFKLASATGNGAALQFFNLGNGNCNGTGYDVANVPAGNGYVTLPSTGFDSALNAMSPSGMTPTEGAIRGVVAFTARAQNRRAGRKTIGILVTDGDPTECDTNLTNLRNILQTHFAATGVMTFVVGMTGASDANLETMATGGNGPTHPATVNGVAGTCGTGTAPCRHWNVGAGNASVFVEALRAIQAAAVGCTYTIPQSDAGVVDPSTVRVEYLPGGQPPPTVLKRVTDAAGCAGVTGGFYYDSNTNPTSIILCPTQCTVVQGDAKAKLNVLFGCQGG